MSYRIGASTVRQGSLDRAEKVWDVTPAGADGKYTAYVAPFEDGLRVIGVTTEGYLPTLCLRGDQVYSDTTARGAVGGDVKEEVQEICAALTELNHGTVNDDRLQEIIRSSR